MKDWLCQHWVASALCMGIFLLLLAPVLAGSWDLAILLIYLQSPIYMLHQVEEHTGDRFRTFVNRHAFGGLEALTPGSILWINIPGVWGVTLLSLYAAVFLGVGWGLTGVYLVLVNGAAHVIGLIARGSPNPGVWTSLALFLPVGGLAWRVVATTAGVTRVHHAVGLAVAIVIHAVILVYGHTRARRLRVALP